MEHASFESPLSDEQLKELGRLVVNCGFVEFLVGIHVGMLLKVGPGARIDLINPLSTRRKTEILKQGLKGIPRKETRELVAQACDLIGPTIRHRNAMLHGIWGFDGDQTDAKPIVVSTKERAGRFPAGDISKCADTLAFVSRNLSNALLVDSDGKSAETPERLVILP
jgi:hypothetical protein